MAQYYAIIDANGAFTGRTYSDTDIPTKTSENWPGSLAEPSAHHRPIEDQPDEFHTWDNDAGKWILPLEPYRAIALGRIKEAGYTRVYQEYPEQAQRRLAFKAASDDERKTCGSLIEAVKTLVDDAERTILEAKKVADIQVAEGTFNRALEEVN